MAPKTLVIVTLTGMFGGGDGVAAAEDRSISRGTPDAREWRVLPVSFACLKWRENIV